MSAEVKRAERMMINNLCLGKTLGIEVTVANPMHTQALGSSLNTSSNPLAPRKVS